MELFISLPGNPPRTSQVVIGEGPMDNLMPGLRARLGTRDAFWIWDQKVFNIWGGRTADLGWPGKDSRRLILFAASERNKRLAAVEMLARELVTLGADRQSTLVAVGGGVTGDVVGFLAAIYMRGIPFFQIPTTLLAHVDSSVGGKTGVDLPEGKNLLGAFHQPEVVWIYPDFLESLPEEEFRQGMAEVIKTAVLGDEDLFRYLEEHTEAIRLRESASLSRVVSACCRVKAAVVESDEKERGLRRVLNLGHTVGHALERLSGYEIRHGDAVAMGMVAAAKLACESGKAPPEVPVRIERLCAAWNLPVRLPEQFEPDSILDAMKSDKKRLGSVLHFVLPARIGKVTDCVDPDMDLLKAVLGRMREKTSGS